MIEIKPISFEDAELLSEIAVKAYSDHYLHLWYDGGEWYLKKSFDAANLRKEIADEANKFYLAIFDGESVGFLKTRTDRVLPGFENQKAFEIERIYLMKKAQGKGIGRALMEFSFERARNLKLDLVWLKAMDTSESAVEFYKKLGFETCGRETLDFPQMKTELRGMLVMKKSLGENRSGENTNK